MLQIVDGKECFVADLKEIPPLPITYDDTPELKYYAQALEIAIRTGLVTGPGKYAIEVDPELNWQISRIIED